MALSLGEPVTALRQALAHSRGYSLVLNNWPLRGMRLGEWSCVPPACIQATTHSNAVATTTNPLFKREQR